MHEKVRYQCSYCDKMLFDLSSLKKHIDSKHKGIRFACGQCSYEATDQSNLNRSF